MSVALLNFRQPKTHAEPSSNYTLSSHTSVKIPPTRGADFSQYIAALKENFEDNYRKLKSS